MPSRVVVGTQWGDEGKGKITDFLAKEADLIVRFQGGTNAGHTVKIGNEVFKFHLVPSGIIRSEKTSVIGNGVVVDPKILLQEIDALEKSGREVKNLRISERAQVIMPYHKILDALEEDMKGKLKAGTTKRGIGPCYTDKVARFGIRMVDLLDDEVFRAKLETFLPIKQKIIEAFGGTQKLSLNEIFSEYKGYAEKLRKYVTDTSILINEALDQGRNVLFEGAQGTHLGIDHGIYPYGTSSNTVAGGACTGAGVGPTRIDKVIGVMKAYTSRVGTGPFPAEIKNELGDHIRERGREYGTTTGRPRRCGWLDLVMVLFSKRVNALDSIVITKIDVLSGIEKVKICEAYECDGERIEDFPANMRTLEKCRPVYKEFEGWPDIEKDRWKGICAQGHEALPSQMKEYIGYIEEFLGLPVDMISVGPAREETIDLRK